MNSPVLNLKRPRQMMSILFNRYLLKNILLQYFVPAAGPISAPPAASSAAHTQLTRKNYYFDLRQERKGDNNGCLKIKLANFKTRHYRFCCRRFYRLSLSSFRFYHRPAAL